MLAHPGYLPISASRVMELQVATTPAYFRCDFLGSKLPTLQSVWQVLCLQSQLLSSKFDNLQLLCFFFDGEHTAGHRRN